jgi:dTDP-4-dehydrorhamnose reductase
MKILVTGAAGQVGHEVGRAEWPSGWTIAACDRAALDITDAAGIAAALADQAPDLAINLAAYTAVDRAESEPDLARRINCTGAALLAAACAEAGVPLVQLSTDYVFDGSKRGPYREDDPVAPLGVYGSSKEAGERAVRAASDRHVILRTSWVYGVHGTNFVKTMLRLMTERPALRVVADQTGCPTGAADIARALVAIAARIAAGQAQWGTFHFAGAGAVTWHGFAEAIVALAAPRLGRRPPVAAIATAEYPTPARRPANSVLDCAKIAAEYGILPRPWQMALAEVVDELLK